MTSLFGELKRRNVFRVGVAYCVLGWLIIQITDTVAPALRLPDWTLTVVTWFGVIGLPFALLFAWAFEMTPEGIKRTEDVSPEESVTSHTGRRLTHITLGLMAAVIVILLVDRQGVFTADKVEQAVTGESVVAPPPAAEDDALDSIAVLPFVNMSSDQENQFFGDGLAEEILNQLAAIEALRVAARTSSFYFRDKDPTIAEVAEALDVDAVLEGSIQRSGNTIRVVAQLIRASDSAHLWSSKYDRPLDDYFEVQDDIARHIMQAMMPHLAGAPATSSKLANLVTPEVFEQLALAKKRYWEIVGSVGPNEREQFAAVTRAAPDYAPGWSWLAMAWLSSSSAFGGDVAAENARQEAELNIQKALELDVGDSVAHHAMARLLARQGNLVESEKRYVEALELDSQNVGAALGLGNLLAFEGRAQEALALLERARLIDPLHPHVLRELIHLYGLTGEDRAAFAALERLAAINKNMALDAEIHLYGDRGDLAREVYLLETSHQQGLGSSAPQALEWAAFSVLYAGLYDHPLVAGSRFESLALALQGQSEAATALLEKPEPTRTPNIFDVINMALTQMVLGHYDATEALLWPVWLDADRKIGFSFRYRMAEVLFSALLLQEKESRAQELAVALRQAHAEESPLHSGSYNRDSLFLAALTGEQEEALELLERMVADGYWGGRDRGPAVAGLWPLHDDPRFPALAAGMERNYQYQMAELERLRNAGFSLAEFRQDYLNRIDLRPAIELTPGD